MTMDDALSSDAMDAESSVVTMDEPSSGQSTAGVCVRCTADTTITNYYTRFEHAQGAGSGTWNVEFGQRVTGTKTNFGGNDDRGDPGLPTVLKLSVNGDASVLEVFLDAVSETSGDDSASEIGVGNVNGGFTIFTRPGSVSQVEMDDFSTTDNISGGTSIPVFMYHYQRMQRA